MSPAAMPPPRKPNNQPTLKLDQLWLYLPEMARQMVVQALIRVILQTTTAESEVTQKN